MITLPMAAAAAVNRVMVATALQESTPQKSVHQEPMLMWIATMKGNM